MGKLAGLDKGMLPKPTIEWMRAYSEETDVAKRKIWRSKCGAYRVVESKSKYGLSKVYYAMKLGWRGSHVVWCTLSKHKLKSAAQKACQAQYSVGYRIVKTVVDAAKKLDRERAKQITDWHRKRTRRARE